MADVDRIAVDEVGIGLLQMMEHAARTLAWHAQQLPTNGVTVLAGSGGNGGGGLAAASHLRNRGVSVTVVLDRSADAVTGAAGRQLAVLHRMDVPIQEGVAGLPESRDTVVVDALVGYGLTGDLRGQTADIVRAIDGWRGPVLALDVPTGIDATSGDVLGLAVTPTRTVTLALPKTGLRDVPGELYLADLGLPEIVFRLAGIEYVNPFGSDFWIQIEPGSDP